jgi:hypothetical protein
MCVRSEWTRAARPSWSRPVAAPGAAPAPRPLRCSRGGFRFGRPCPRPQRPRGLCPAPACDSVAMPRPPLSGNPITPPAAGGSCLGGPGRWPPLALALLTPSPAAPGAAACLETCNRTCTGAAAVAERRSPLGAPHAGRPPSPRPPPPGPATGLAPGLRPAPRPACPAARLTRAAVARDAFRRGSGRGGSGRRGSGRARRGASSPDERGPHARGVLQQGRRGSGRGGSGRGGSGRGGRERIGAAPVREREPSVAARPRPAMVPPPPRRSHRQTKTFARTPSAPTRPQAQSWPRPRHTRCWRS